MTYRVILDGNDILDFTDKAHILLQPALTTELNAAGSFTFTMPPGHAFYNEVKPLLSTIEVYEDEELLWFGRPVEIKTDFWKQRQIYCEGALAFLNDSVQRLHEYDRISLHSFFQTIISAHNEQVAADRQFTIGNITVADKTVYRKLNYESTFDVVKRQILSAEGGYLFFHRENDLNYIDWLAEMPYSCNQPVEFGLNLLELTSDFDGSAIATCVVPLGEADSETQEILTVERVNNGSDVIESEAVSTYGRITRAVTFSGVKEPTTLYADGLEYLQDTQFNNMVIECSAAELHSQNANYEQFRVGQMIHCRSVPHLVDRSFPLVKLSLQLDTAAKQITLGSASRQSLTQIYKEDQETTETNEDSIEERMDSLEELVSELPGVDAEGLEAIGDRIDSLEEIISELSDTETDSFEAVNDRIDSLEEQINELPTVDTGALDTINGRLDSLEEIINDIPEVDTGALDAINARIDSLEELINQNPDIDPSALDAINSRIDSLEELIGQIPGSDPSALDAINARIDSLEDLVNNLPGTDTEGLAALEDRVDALEEMISGTPGADTSSLEETISEVQSDLTNLSELVNGIVDGSNDGWRHWFGTASEYTALGSYDNHTIYYIQSADQVDDYFHNTVVSNYATTVMNR